jgi:hypothetical protein
MKTFKQWAEENKLDLSVVTDTEEKKPATSENRIRTGLSHNYPDAYVRGQYPHKYFNPVKATTDLDLAQKPKTPPDTAAN